MVQFLTPYQAWYLEVKNAIDSDNPIPLPPGHTQPLAIEDYRNWQTFIKQTIHHTNPISPNEWLQSTAKQKSRANYWDDLAKHRINHSQ